MVPVLPRGSQWENAHVGSSTVLESGVASLEKGVAEEGEDPVCLSTGDVI